MLPADKEYGHAMAPTTANVTVTCDIVTVHSSPHDCVTLTSSQRIEPSTSSSASAASSVAAAAAAFDDLTLTAVPPSQPYYDQVIIIIIIIIAMTMFNIVYGAVIMTKVIARVHPVHLMNVD